MTGRLGVLGGTFDPVHYGHLDAASAARHALGLPEILFVPSHAPPHRPRAPRASALQRFALVALAINGCPGYRVSDMELRRSGRSYTSDTLRELHAEGWQPRQIVFIIGSDAFAEIASWHEFPAVLDAAQFAVIARPGAALDRALGQTPDLRRRLRRPEDAADDDARTGVYLVERDTRDISSTDIRTRLAAGQPIDGLVPDAVARHIAAHHLYRVDDDLHGSSNKDHGA